MKAFDNLIVCCPHGFHQFNATSCKTSARLALTVTQLGAKPGMFEQTINSCRMKIYVAQAIRF
jgi:hypothetical protein